ncbi:hypothetical protein EV651_110251 [Kribbella sp. VKM Ac-2571]|uniref:DUF7665 family protein n=1 Tax=Kribbella sp. VKM Ac-2571 TaxID=2512222 RepID=UPI0010612DF1|nr:hypothetical protein [Kribbella sp. VKM Ac-2571]TDO58215.1 hypothetical protein EV651_110251 [Kribbella sp. VKM Ac-2571]
MDPDERALVDDLESIRFLAASDRGYWRLVARDNTLVTFELAARTGRQLGVRLDCAGYPAVPPTSQLWSVEADQPLPVAEWPTGGRASQVFNPNWSQRYGGAFYYPYDRRALEGHGGWANDHTGHVWTVDTTVVDALYLLREILRSATGPAPKELAAGEAS